ncbi:MAG: hypothetical protein LUE17_05835 [Planctomycetaceae bacterium]|nr:hypothetical protein [Planctomycetaceae bacterium]
MIMNQIEAGEYIGRSYEFLRQRAQEHDLFKPSNGESISGVPSMYHRKHLELIALHLLFPSMLTAGGALKAWRSKSENEIRAAYEEIDAAMAAQGREKVGAK